MSASPRRQRRPVVLLRPVPGHSPVHELWAGTKLLAVAGVGVLLTFYPGWIPIALVAVLAVGTALGLRAQGLEAARTWVLVGDAEMDEGSNHEAVAFAGAVGLDGLHVVAVDNTSSTHGWRGGLAGRFAVEGWSTLTVDGRDHEALYEAFTAPHPGQPHAVVARVEPKYA